MPDDKGLKGLISEWRSVSEPDKGIGSKGVFKGEVQRACADELQPFLERLEALEQRIRSDYHSNYEQEADELRSILHGEQPKGGE